MCHLMCSLMYACAVGIYVLFDVCAADPCVHVLFHVLLGVCMCVVDPCVLVLFDACVLLICVYLCCSMCVCC